MADELESKVEPKWYVIHTYSGYENKVKTTLDKLVENRGLQEMITEIKVPIDEVYEVKDGKKKPVKKKRFPGYVFVKMVYNEEIWYIVRNTRGVTGFVGPDANRPLPLTESDMIAMGLIEENFVPEVDYGKGDTVRVISGPFADSLCSVDEMNYEKQQVKVKITMFGRETPVYLDFTQVVKL